MKTLKSITEPLAVFLPSFVSFADGDIVVLEETDITVIYTLTSDE